MTSRVATLPPALKKGDTIAYISPSSRVNKIFPVRLARAAAFWQSKGYKTKEIFDPIPRGTSHVAAVKIRCDEIHRAFADPEVKAIICTIGGSTANELLRHLDYALIAANPKIFCGYSDITLLHHAFYTQANLRTFYGAAMIPEWGEYPAPHALTQESFLAATTTTATPSVRNIVPSTHFTQEFLDWDSPESNQRARHFEAAPERKWLRPGSASGRIFGGCLPSLKQLVGTPYWPEYEGKILFFETPEGPTAPDAVYTVEMARLDLCDLRNAGVLDRIVGIVVGRPLFYDEAMRAEFERMIIDQTEGLEVPILCHVDIGHTCPGQTIPLDVAAALSSEKDEFVLLEPGVAAE